MIFDDLEKRAEFSMVPVMNRKRDDNQWKEHQKLWGSISRMFELMKLSQSYPGTKGSLECKVEDPPENPRRGAWCWDLEESASHHFDTNQAYTIPGCYHSLFAILIISTR